MILMQNRSSDSFGDSSYAIAKAYGGAFDEDTREVLNAMAQPERRSSLTFYLVPCTWMAICLPFLTGQSEERPTAKIENASLLVTGEVSDEEQDDTNMYESRGRPESSRLRTDIKHQRDFHCIGSNVWGLVSEKFGFDVELAFKVAEGRQQGILAIDLITQKVDIPVTGWFDYRPIARIPTDVVSDEEDDLFPGPSGLSRHSVPQPQDDTMAPSTSTAIIVLPPSESSDGGSKASDMDIEQPIRNSTLKRKRYGSGLGNLGNTCFMNSTLQCLAHTEPLRRYFCSGAYQNDLNRENPLGTGGELATTFAELLCEMWGSRETAAASFNGVVYPRSFKYTLGKHAEQFLGYDQHDSQELATYLLDALHEDTNRVTKKPYVEKPEQGEDEPDDIAAKKAWEFHLQREDSRVLENFVGQVKSRVQCPTDGCGRVSTTFDPFMYLSVPIPGATDRTLKVTLVPLKGPRLEIQFTVPKTGTILTLKKKIVEQSHKLGLEGINMKDLLAVDVWNNEVYSVYKPTDDVDKVRDTDITFVYQLTPSSEFRAPDASGAAIISLAKRNRPNRIKLSVEDLALLNARDNWMKTIEDHVNNVVQTSMLFNPNRATKESLIRFYDQLGEFIDRCYEALHSVVVDDAGTENKDENDGDADVDLTPVPLEALQNRAVGAVCRASTLFSRVSEVRDVGILEFAESKLRAHIVDHIMNAEEKNKEGINIQVLFHRKDSTLGTHRNRTDKFFAAPLCLRVASNTTVYGLREILADRLPFKDEGLPQKPPASLAA